MRACVRACVRACMRACVRACVRLCACVSLACACGWVHGCVRHARARACARLRCARVPGRMCVQVRGCDRKDVRATWGRGPPQLCGTLRYLRYSGYSRTHRKPIFITVWYRWITWNTCAAARAHACALHACVLHACVCVACVRERMRCMRACGCVCVCACVACVCVLMRVCMHACVLQDRKSVV